MGMVEIAIAVALGIIVAVLVLRFWPYILGAGIFLVVAGLLFYVGYVGVMPVIDAYMKVRVENPEAPLVLLFGISVFAVPVFAYYLWSNRSKAKKESTSSATPPTVGASKKD